jgi:hypothetical protein
MEGKKRDAAGLFDAPILAGGRFEKRRDNRR